VKRVQNLSRTLAELKGHFCTVIGLDSEGPDAIEELAWPERPVLVLGSEGRGLRDRIRQSCDKLCRIATSGAASLNVSNSAAIALHLAAMHRSRPGKPPR
jgi:23S rRNA (guanosine2251-2'-O)-methyltransferase